MIKYHIFNFEELNVPDHWVSFPNFGTCIKSVQKVVDHGDQVEITLDPDKVYQLSMDQSSSNTGIFIKDYKNTEAYMIEVKRQNNQSASDYIYDLEVFLHQICEECTFSHLIYEKPITSESYRSSQVAFQLEGTICSLGKRYREFASAKIDNIENSSWRRVVVDKKFEAQGYNRKEQSRQSVMAAFPWTADYGMSVYKDQDIFEAVGVMMGWFINSFDAFGRPYVRGDRTTATIGGFIFPGLPGRKVMELMETQGIEAQFYVENVRYPIYKNLTAGMKPYEVHVVEFSNKYAMLALCIECNVKWMDPDVMSVVLMDANTVDTRLKEISGGQFHFVL